MKPLISVAATMQIFEARTMGAEMAKLLNAKDHISGHPEHGIRPEPDEMAFVVETLFATFGRMPCRWPESEFRDAVKRHMQKPPAYGAGSEGLEFTVGFPCGDQWSYCVATAERHPRYGNGLMLLQSFPVEGFTDAEGIRQAIALNGTELGEDPFGYGFGGYSYADNKFFFKCFLPNVVYKPNLLPSLYFSSIARAYRIAFMITGEEWEEWTDADLGLT